MILLILYKISKYLNDRPYWLYLQIKKSEFEYINYNQKK